jgi:hypothetical protein
LLERAKPTAKQAAAWLRDLQGLPPMPAMTDRIDFGERLVFLDTIQLVQRGGIAALEGLSNGGSHKQGLSLAQQLGQWAIDSADWDPALRNANRLHDRLAAAVRVKDRAARQQQLLQIEADLVARKKALVDSGDLANLLIGTAEAKGRVLGELLIGLLFPAVRKVQQAADRTEQEQSNLHIAFALAAYKSDQGRYPPKLDDLAPKYLAKVPDDLFSGKPLIYRPSDDGYLLYSVGMNGKDDAGRSKDDDPPGDDLTIRMPLPERKRPARAPQSKEL